MLFETQLPSPDSSAYRQHAFLERMFSQGYDAGEYKRDYLWCEQDGMLMIRRSMPSDDLLWWPIDVPPINSMINFQLQARCRKNRGRDRFANFRPSYDDPYDCMQWLENQPIGLRFDDIEVEIGVKTIRTDGSAKHPRDFQIVTASFNGVATVLDQSALERGLIMGIGDSKAFGLGLMQFRQRGQHA